MNKELSKVIHYDTSPYPPELVNHTDRAPTLQEMQQWVGGSIEVVNVLFHEKACQMIVNDEGAVNGLPVNIRATSIYHCASIYQRGKVPDALIHGRAILLFGLALE